MELNSCQPFGWLRYRLCFGTCCSRCWKAFTGSAFFQMGWRAYHTSSTAQKWCDRRTHQGSISQSTCKGYWKSFPTQESEMANPQAADDLYRAGTTWLLGQTRDTKSFPLVFKENIAFGFQRNTFGLRIIGIWVSILCFLVVLVITAYKTNFVSSPTLKAITNIGAPQLVAFAVSLAFLSMWIFGHTEQALQRTAFAYALRLLESCDHLAQPKTPATKKRPISPTA